MVSRKVLCLLILLCSESPNAAHSFVNPKSSVASKPWMQTQNLLLPSSLNIPRGGESQLNMAITSIPPMLQDILVPALKSGPYGVLALTTVAATAVVPLTLYKQLYSISVGYGAAILLIGGVLQYVFQPAITGQAFTGALMLYGIRLAAYLLLREKTRKSPPTGGMKDSSPLKRLPLAVSVSLFYAFLTAPTLYMLRNTSAILDSSSPSAVVTKLGIGLAFGGAALEAVADWQKYLVKQSAGAGVENQFIGPTGGTYAICRHPNYLGEILFWMGVFVGGVPSFGTSIIAWISSMLGLYGIVSIMTKATSRLEGRQEETYGGQEKYDTWVKKVKSPLFPFL